MAGLSQMYWLKTVYFVSIIFVNILADNSQKDCQHNEVYIYCGSCEGTCKEPVIVACKKDCRPARCECRSRSGFVRAHDGKCIHVSECASYQNTYSGASSMSANKSPSPPPLRNSNQPAVSSSGFGFPSPSSGQIIGNGMSESIALQSHIRGAPPSASPLLPPVSAGGEQQPFFADVPQANPEEWHHQQLSGALSGALPPSQQPEQVPPAALDQHNWPSLQTTLQTAADIPSESKSWDFMQDSASSLAPSQLPPGTSLASNRNSLSVSDPPSSFTPEPSEDPNATSNAGWSANNAGTAQKDPYSMNGLDTDTHQNYQPIPPKLPGARSYGASSRQSLPVAQSQPVSRSPSALPVVDALSLSCVNSNCTGFSALKPVVAQQQHRKQDVQQQPQQVQPKPPQNSTPKSRQPYLFAYISYPPGYGPAELMKAKTERMGIFQPIANVNDVDIRRNGFESGGTPPPAQDIPLLPPNYRIYRNV